MIRSIIRKTAVTALLGAVLAGQAFAVSYTITNGSFEQGDSGHTAVGGWTLPGWELGNNGGLAGKQDITTGVGTQWNSVSDGNCAAFFNGSFEFLQQTSAVIQEGVIYTMQVDLGQRMDFNDNWNTFGLAFYAKGPGDTSLTYLTGAQAYRDAVPEGGWYTATLSYMADIPAAYGKNLVIKLENPGGLQPWIDNVRLSDNTVVPEPSAFAALLGGIATIGGSLIRRRK